MVRVSAALARESISIHAPRAGCDLASFKNISIDEAFQSTHPVRGATHGKKCCNGVR